MRALSTILLAATLAHSAAAQFPGAPRDVSGDAFWLSASRSTVRAANFSDYASGGTWQLAQSQAVGMALDWGQSFRSIGIAVDHATIPLQFNGSLCTNCAGEVQALRMMATYKRASPLFGSGLLQLIDVGLGVTQWSGLKGRDTSTLPIIATKNDFTYSISIGVGLPLGDGFEAFALYDMLQTRHAAMGASGSSSSSSIGQNAMRLGARLRLSR